MTHHDDHAPAPRGAGRLGQLHARLRAWSSQLEGNPLRWVIIYGVPLLFTAAALGILVRVGMWASHSTPDMSAAAAFPWQLLLFVGICGLMVYAFYQMEWLPSWALLMFAAFAFAEYSLYRTFPALGIFHGWGWTHLLYYIVAISLLIAIHEQVPEGRPRTSAYIMMGIGLAVVGFSHMAFISSLSKSAGEAVASDYCNVQTAFRITREPQVVNDKASCSLQVTHGHNCLKVTTKTGWTPARQFCLPDEPLPNDVVYIWTNGEPFDGFIERGPKKYTSLFSPGEQSH